MYGLSAGVWPEVLAGRASARDRQHQITIYDARIAEEQADSALRRTDGLVGRVRQSLGLAPAPIPCPACAA